MPKSHLKFILNMKYKLVYLLATLISFAACEKRDIIRNGAVDIEIVKPLDNASIAKTDKVELEIKFTSNSKNALVKTAIVEMNAFKEGKEALEALDVLPSGVGETVVDFEKPQINESEYLFKQTVDISAYPVGTCFIIYGGAESDSEHTGGTELKGSYFCIQ